MNTEQWQSSSGIPGWLHYLLALAVITSGVFLGNLLHTMYIAKKAQVLMDEAAVEMTKELQKIKLPDYSIPAAPPKPTPKISGCGKNSKTGECQCFDERGFVVPEVPAQICYLHAE
ncbi:hypothetical protein [Chitinimonas taiwanensis]|uniref:Uncharacterized protein n=1 Tax=Chitinimonas taiwanensis DSM 18899 TaxID=1121279 RepID=A0A1K2HDM4_9NEIS|nr:hypothetical protein [Chitinimonas taiwanensis]SFZ74928.1 hypothetical protein SAMN02745887_01391 [Chitinimonas taiwanensis DSM 18899]